MNRKKTTFLLLTAILVTIALVVPIASAQPEPAVVLPYIDGATWYADDDQPIDMFWAWVATTRGLVRVYLRHSYESYTLTNAGGDVIWDESATDTELYFGPLQSATPDALGVECPMPYLWGTFWENIHDPLPADTYTLEWNQTFEQPVNDGFHVCNDPETGDPIVTPPSLYEPGTSTATSTIIVSEATP